jgi:malonate transporter
LANLAIILGAILPIFALIALGAGLRRSGFPGESFWPQVERLTYYLLFPALLVESLATAAVDMTRIGPIALAVVLMIGATTALLLFMRGSLGVDGPRFTSIYQCTIRFNSYLGVAIAFEVFGSEGGAIAAVLLAVMIPVVNVLCVFVLSRFAGRLMSPWRLAKDVALNPLILACLLGILLNVTGLGLPYVSQEILEIIGRAALPLGLMTVGAGLPLRAVRPSAAVVHVATVLKLLAMPLSAWQAALALGLSTLEMQVLVLFAALPTAPDAAYIFARLMGGDYEVIPAMGLVQIALSLLTLPLLFVLLQ